MNDVILNRRVTILDKEALLDAKRSLTVMLGDFLRQHKVRGGSKRLLLRSVASDASTMQA
jgi:hypothetical protein